MLVRIANREYPDHTALSHTMKTYDSSLILSIFYAVVLLYLISPQGTWEAIRSNHGTLSCH